MLRFRTYILLIILIGIALYARGLFNGFVGDDDLQIVRNYLVHSFFNFPTFFFGTSIVSPGAQEAFGVFYRPIMMTTFSLIYTFFGPNPFFFHLLQISLHITNTLLLFVFLRYFLKDKISFILSLFFLVHPINSEAVLYVANLQEVLFVFFGMVALLLLRRKYKSFRSIIPISLAIFLSLLSKESGVLFIAIVLLYSWLFDKDKKRFKMLLASQAITFGIYLFLRDEVSYMFAGNNVLSPISHIALAARMLNIPAIIFYYFRMFVYPVSIGGYEFWVVKSMSFANFWGPLLVSLALLALIALGFVWTIKKHNRNIKIYLFFMFWLIVGLLLHIQILPLDATVADRWFYFPIIGLLGILGVVCMQLHLLKNKRNQIIVGSLISVILVLLSVRTFVRIGDWHDPLSLYSYDISNSPPNFILDNAYGQALIKNNDFYTAMPYIKRSVQEHPYPANLNNLAIIYAATGSKDKANEYFKKAIATGKNFSVYENYDNFLLYYYGPVEALTFARKAEPIFPQSGRIWLVIAQSLYIEGDTKNALRAIAHSYKLEPNPNTLAIFVKMQHNKPLVFPKL